MITDWLLSDRTSFHNRERFIQPGGAEESTRNGGDTGLRRALAMPAEQQRDGPYQQRLRCRVTTLGGFEVLTTCQAWQDRQQRSGRYPKILRLLKIIIALGSEQIPLDVLLETIYPDADPKRSRGRLEAQLSRLRQALGYDRKCQAIRIQGGLLSLSNKSISIDLIDFLRAAKQAQTALSQTDKQAVRVACERALLLYQGPFLPEERYADWAIARREMVERQVVEILQTLAGWATEEGARHLAERYLRRCLTVDSCNEEVVRCLMALCLESRRSNEAVRVYQRARSSLCRTYDLEPEEATEALYRKALAR